MDLNPYEAPRERSGKASQTAVVALRVFAVLAWILPVVPIAFFFIGFAVYEDYGRRRGLPTDVLIGLIVALFLPSVGLVLVGAAGWRRSLWLAVAGFATFVPIIAILAYGLATGWREWE